MQSAYRSALARMVHDSYKNDGVAPFFSDRMLRLAHVIWAVWENADETLHARVILGRELDRPDLLHVVQDEAVREQVTMGDPIHTDGNGILRAPEPAVPDHMPSLLVRAFGHRTGA